MGLRAGIAESLFGDLRDVLFVGAPFLDLRGDFVPVLQRPAVEKVNEAGAVMLLDHVDDRLVELVFERQIDAVFDMRDDDQRTHRRGWAIVRVFALADVFDE
ncbi:MAG: hypothetical protein R3F11_02615 [Verrucomicrobiales bacterium]